MKMTAKTIWLVLLSMMITALSINDSAAQPKKRLATRKYLIKTTLVIFAAKKELKQGGVFTGDFSRAVAHQRYAIKLFNKKDFQKAFFHSHLARAFAFKSIKANNEPVWAEWENTQEEDDFLKDQELPSDDDLIRELEQELPDFYFDDASLLEESLEDLDIEDIIDEN